MASVDISGLGGGIHYERGCDDQSFCKAVEMIEMFVEKEIDSMHYFFELSSSEIAKQKEITEDHLKIVFKYGRLLELLERHDKAIFYFQYVADHSRDSDFLQLLSYISIQGRGGTISLSKEILAQISGKIDALQRKEKFLAIVYLSSLLELESMYDLVKSKHYLIDSIDSGIESKLFLYSMINVYHSANDERYVIANELLRRYEQKESLMYAVRCIQKSKEYNARNDYKGMLIWAKKAVEIEFGEFSTPQALIKNYKSSPYSYGSSFEHYANSLLFQTRIAKDTTPVVNAFEMYRAIYSQKLRLKFSAIEELIGSRSSISQPIHENILIIGNYLHGKNGEMSYLNESVQIMDGFIGAGAVFWTKVREQMRFDPGFKQELEQLHQRGEDLRNATQDISLTELNQRVQDLWKAEDEFKSRYPELFSGEFEEVKIDLEEISREMARDSSAVVSFYGNDLILYRLFVSGDSIEVKILNGYRAEVEQLSADLPKLLANPKASARADTLGHRLYAMLLGDIDSILPPRLHVITSGSLSDVSFAGLRTSPPGTSAEYLGTRQALSRQFSIGSMLALRNLELSPRYARPLALAPSFGDDFIAAGELRQAGFVLPPLLYNKEELDNLQEQSAGKYLYDDRATLEEYREFAPDYGIIHLASHAISSKMNGVLSRVFLLDEKGDPVPLYASDIGQETLNAELVVLSACETGGGGLHEIEGLVGLTRAYLAAGARSVVSSSWAVDDRATSELMETFYAATAAGQAPHDALRTARRAYRQLHPDAPVANWAAFEAYGGMQPVNWQREGGHLPWGWIGGGFVALLGGGLLLRRRAA